MRKERSLDDRELSRPALELAKRFVQRWDLHARQLDDGRYICVHEHLSVDHLFAHLRGEITLGSYVLNQESQARFVVYDADDARGYESLTNLGRSLADEGIPAYLENSRRGGHLWLFFAQPVLGKSVRAFAQGMLENLQVENVEIFPKQDRLVGGPGSLIRMPFGVHRLTGHRYGFYLPDGSPLAPTIRGQIRALSTPQVVPEDAFEAYTSYVSFQPSETPYMRPDESTDTLSERIKTSITVLEFVSQYVDLKPTGTGALGLYPFHDDHNPSLGVNDQKNYWHCFAGCGGGSIVDFWMKWRGVDFTDALRELAGMCL